MDNFSINITRSGRLQQIIDRLKQQQNMNVKVGILDDPDTAKYASCVEFGWTQTTHSSILAWRIPWTEKSGRLQSMGSKSVKHD